MTLFWPGWPMSHSIIHGTGYHQDGATITWTFLICLAFKMRDASNAWHQGGQSVAHDNNFKDMMIDFTMGSCDARREVIVGKQPIRIDLVLECHDQALLAEAIPAMAGRTARVNVFEFKSSHDRPGAGDLPKLAGYVGLYCAGECIGLESLGTCAAWYITARRPAFMDDLLSGGVLVPTGTAGIYIMA